MADVDDLAAHLCELDHGHDGPCWDNLTIAGRALKWLANRRRPAVADRTIPDEAVEDALDAYDAYMGDGSQRSESAFRAGLVAAYPHLAAHERERVARYIDRAVASKRQTAAQGLLADTIVADSWAEVAGWLRENSIWAAPEHETEEPVDALLTRPEEGTNA